MPRYNNEDADVNELSKDNGNANPLPDEVSGIQDRDGIECILYIHQLIGLCTDSTEALLIWLALTSVEQVKVYRIYLNTLERE